MKHATVPQSDLEQSQTHVASVLETSNGEALRISIENASNPLTVAAHTTNVPWLEVGDQVLVSLTSLGPIITHRLRRPQEVPGVSFEVRDGVAQLDNVRAIQLKAGKSTLELNADGRVRLDGTEIVSWAEHRMELVAATIEIN